MGVSSPVTEYLRETKGMTLKFYCKQHGLSYNSLRQVLHGMGKSKKVIDQLKKDGLWELMPKEAKNVRDSDSVSL